MAFPSDGRNHYNAIKSETTLNKFHVQIENFFGKKIQSYIHIGGTRNKVDVKIILSDGEERFISLKHKKDITKGSFDWVNTTLFPKECFRESMDAYNKFKGTKNLDNKLFLENKINKELFSINEKYLTQIFYDLVVQPHYDNNIEIFIIDDKQNKIHRVEPKLFSLINEGYSLVIVPHKGKTSAKVFCKNKNNELVDLGLRIRLHLNNGWTKWLKGENSVLCLKFQQDSVYKILK